jgi:voltage-gated potassium channel
MSVLTETSSRAAWREKARIIIFEAETRDGKAFDVALLVAIVLSVGAVMLESVPEIRKDFGPELRVAEWLFTFLFTLEYAARLVSTRHPWQYARSFFGIVDLLAIVPTYLSVLLPGAQSLLVIRALRLLRIFRVFKLVRFLGEAHALSTAIVRSRHKVVVFLGSVLCLVTILGAAMYLIEGAESGFTSIPVSVYWAIVTMTTVGYGDIAPQTVAGRALAAMVMILGYAIIAVPTGIVTAELVQTVQRHLPTTRVCMQCLSEGHARDARYCQDCGAKLEPMQIDGTR